MKSLLKEKRDFYRKKVEMYCAEKIYKFVQVKTQDVGDC